VKLSSFRRLMSVLLVGILTGTSLLPQSVFAAPTGSAYRTVMDSLSPYRYFPFDNNFGTQGLGDTPTMLGSATTNNAVFIGVTSNGAAPVVPFNDGTQNENTGLGSAPTVGRTLSPGWPVSVASAWRAAWYGGGFGGPNAEHRRRTNTLFSALTPPPVNSFFSRCIPCQ